jgi:hypothetical protein
VRIINSMPNDGEYVKKPDGNVLYEKVDRAIKKST